MSNDRICAVYSRGPHFVRMLRCLREIYPDATLVAAIPTSFAYNAIDGLVDETLRLPDGDAVHQIRGAWTALRRVRKAKCSHLVIMFDSTRLNLLCAFSGARQRRCFTVDGRFYTPNRGPLVLVATELRRRITGQWHYFCAWSGSRRQD